MYYDHNTVAAEGPRVSFYSAIIKTRNVVQLKKGIGSVSHSLCITSLQLPKAFWCNVNDTEGDLQDNFHVVLN